MSIWPRYVARLREGWHRQFGASQIAHRLAHGTFWTASGNVLGRAINVVTTMIVTHILGRESYGKISLIQNTVDMFVMAGGLGLSVTATKHIGEFRRSDPDKAGRVIAMTSIASWLSGALISLIFLGFAPWIADETLHAPSMTNMLRIGACLLFFSTVNSAQIGSLTGLEAFKRRAAINVATSLLALPLTVAGARLGGPIGAVCGFVATAAFLTSMNAVAVRRETRRAGIALGWKKWSSEAPLLLRFGIPSMAGSIFIPVAAWIGNTLLVRTPGGFAELGLYNAANQWYNAIMFLPMILSVVSIPILSDLVRSDDWSTVGKLTWKSVRLHSLIVFPAIALAVAGPWIMRAYGRGFSGGTPVMVLQLGSAVIAALNAPLWPVFFAAGKVRTVFTMNLVLATLFVFLSWFGVHWGAIGLAASGFVANLAFVSGMLVLVHRLIRRGARRKISKMATILTEPAPAP